VPNVNVITPEGQTVSIPEETLPGAIRAGYRRESVGAEILRAQHEGQIEPYTGTRGAIEAGVQGVIRGASLGLSDILQGAAGDSERLRALKEAHPKVSLGAEILGGLAPGIASGGAGELAGVSQFAPSGLLSRGATSLTERVVGGGGAVREIGGSILGGALEGGVQNVGSYLSDVALENKDLSAEGLVGSLGQGALFGGGAGGALAGVHQGTLAARRLFPRLAGGGKEAAQVAEETFHAAANDALKAGDDLEKVARDELATLRIRRRELELHREQLRGAKDPASRVKTKEIALELEQNRAALKSLRDAKNAERATKGLADLPPDAPLLEPPPSTAPVANDVAPPVPANDVAPIEPANANLPGEVAPSLHGSDDLMARLGATKQALDEGIPFTEIGKAENDLTVAADDAHHEASMLADDAVNDAIADIDRKEQKVERYAQTKQSVRDYIAGLKGKADQVAETGREISYRPLQEGSDVLGVGASKRSGKVVTPVGPQEIEARAGDQVFAGVGRNAAAADASGLSREMNVGGSKLRFDVKTEELFPGSPPADQVQQTTVTAYRTIDNGKEVEAGSAEFIHREGEKLDPRGVVVEPDLRRKGVASRMYALAEESTGGRIVASGTQTDEGRKLSEAFRAKRDAAEEPFRVIGHEPTPAPAPEVAAPASAARATAATTEPAALTELPTGPIRDTDDFAARVRLIMERTPAEPPGGAGVARAYGGDKVFLHHVRDEMGLSKQEFQRWALKALNEDKVQLARLDLMGALNKETQERVGAEKIDDFFNAFVRPRKPRGARELKKPATPAAPPKPAERTFAPIGDDEVIGFGRGFGQTDDEASRNAVRRWQTSSALQKNARSDGLINESLTAEREALENVVASGRVPRDVRLYRGVGPAYDSSHLKPGSILSSEGFLATSTNREVAETFATLGKPQRGIAATLFEVDAPAGTPAAWASSRPGEREVLFGRRTQLRVKSVRTEMLEEGPARVVTVEVVPSTPSPKSALPHGFDADAVVDGQKLFEGTPTVRKGVPTWEQAGGAEKTGYRENVYVVRPSELVEHDLFGTSWHQTRSDSVRKAWDEGKRLAPLEIDITPSGKLSVQDGNHRLQAAAVDDRPIAVRFRPASSEFAAETGDNIGARVANALPESARPGIHLDQAYEQALEQAAQATTDAGQEKALRRAASLEEQILDRVAKRGGRDAEYVASIRKAREQVGWTPYEVAVRRVEKRLTGEPMTTGKAGGDTAFDDAIRRSEGELGETQGQRARAMIDQLGNDIPGPFRPYGAPVGPKGSLADEILRGRPVSERMIGQAEPPQMMPLSKGRLVDSAEHGIKVFGDFEQAHHELATELGAAAPPAAAAHAQQYALAVDDQARKQAEKLAMNADQAASVVSLPNATKAQTALEKLAGSGLGKRAMDVAGALELLRTVGDLPFVPDPKNIPVIGPMLAMYLKFRGAKAVFNRFGGRIMASTEAKAAVRAAELRDRAAGIVDAVLEGTGKAAKAASKPAAAMAPRAIETLRHSLYPDGQKRDDAKTAAEATKHRVQELAAAASNPEAVKATIRSQMPGADPDLVNAVQNAAMRKLQYLQKNAPKEPPPGPFRSREWLPSKAEVDRFARRVRAADDPISVLQDLEHGTVTPEAAEALREVYPQVFAEVQTRLLTRSAELNAKLPYQKVLQLSLLFDAPLDSSLEPQNLAILQEAHKATQQQAAPAPGQGPMPSAAAQVNLSRLYETPEMRRASRR
jgi:hypothetical protein